MVLCFVSSPSALSLSFCSHNPTFNVFCGSLPVDECLVCQTGCQSGMVCHGLELNQVSGSKNEKGKEKKRERETARVGRED